MIYFDNAATTYPKPQCVYDAINEGMKKFSFNAGRGSYKEANDTFKMINDTREKIANVINSDGSKVIFTSSATESLNHIIYGLDINDDDTILVSPFEHNAIVRTLHSTKAKIIIIPFNKDTWEVDKSALNDIFIVNKPKAVFLSHVSNVTGFLLPYNEIFEIAKENGSITILDAAQSFGIVPINSSNVDFVVFAGHKSLYAAFGAAGYININNVNLKPIRFGGTGSDSLNLNMPDDGFSRFEPGSPNSVSIYAINKSLDYLKEKDFYKQELGLTRYLIEKLKEFDEIKLYLPEDYVSCGIVSFNIEGFVASDVGDILSENFDICVRTGYHCAPYIHDFIGSKEYSGTVRVSLGIFNTVDEIDKFIEAIGEVL